MTFFVYVKKLINLLINFIFLFVINNLAVTEMLWRLNEVMQLKPLNTTGMCIHLYIYIGPH